MMDGDKYANINLTEEQIQGLANEFFPDDVYGIEGQTLMIDGHISITTILLAADYIKDIYNKELSPDLREAYENAEVPDISDDLKARLVSAITRECPEDEEFTKTKRASGD